jgi:hypothetical protein
LVSSASFGTVNVLLAQPYEEWILKFGRQLCLTELQMRLFSVFFAFLNMSSAADFDFNAIPSVAVVCPDILQNRPALWEMAPALPAPIPD